jgi:hypothetical protein
MDGSLLLRQSHALCAQPIGIRILQGQPARSLPLLYLSGRFSELLTFFLALGESGWNKVSSGFFSSLSHVAPNPFRPLLATCLLFAAAIGEKATGDQQCTNSIHAASPKMYACQGALGPIKIISSKILMGNQVRRIFPTCILSCFKFFYRTLGEHKEFPDEKIIFSPLVAAGRESEVSAANNDLRSS